MRGEDEATDGTAAGLTGRLARFARAYGGTGRARVLKDTRVTVVRAGDVVVKAYPPETDETALIARLRVAGTLPGVLLPPLAERPERLDGRLVTVWPAGEPVDPSDPEGAPWETAALLLARLHTAQAAALSLPPAGGPARLAGAVARLSDLSGLSGPRELHGAPGPDPGSGFDGRNGSVATILAAFRSLPAEVRPGPAEAGAAAPAGGVRPLTAGRPAHGDFHLGQIIRYQGEWLLIDVDDLGAGVPAWDLARPAAWYASGLLSPRLWERFLSAYLAAAGPAVSAADPWRELDAPARALTVQLAATAVAAAGAEGRPLDEVEQALVSSCGRIARAAAPQ
ncbi:aminoglycoside phosphotransferase [Sphaerisporangium melleum]|uniref:Aminoglycoside phosphotransferase n=1 Tax=Sphaerisporangium melleum TaxID=321316 RepID=A0A917RK86_9ACTN|nr:aminoglycoside phosphotransferase [Sphaerisporangium melleum]GII74454.1 aminoglycoside phosphotransferase [Sphaerisporangium melleum]